MSSRPAWSARLWSSSAFSFSAAFVAFGRALRLLLLLRLLAGERLLAGGVRGVLALGPQRRGGVLGVDLDLVRLVVAGLAQRGGADGAGLLRVGDRLGFLRLGLGLGVGV